MHAINGGVHTDHILLIVITLSHACSSCPVDIVPSRSDEIYVRASREIRGVIPFVSRENPTGREVWEMLQDGMGGPVGDTFTERAGSPGTSPGKTRGFPGP